MLLALTVVAQLAGVAYTEEQSLSTILLPSIVALLAITTPLAALGLWLGAKINLGHAFAHSPSIATTRGWAAASQGRCFGRRSWPGRWSVSMGFEDRDGAIVAARTA